MVVRLDLRTNRQAYSEDKKSEAKYYLLSSLAALFFLTSLLIFTVGGLRLWLAGSEKSELMQELNGDNDRLLMLNVEFKRLTAQNNEAEKKMDFILGDTPSIELLADIGACLPDGLVIEALTMNPETASLKGVAFGDEEVLSFIGELQQKSSVKAVSLPVITSDQRNGTNLRAFNFELKLNPLAKIMKDSSYLSDAAQSKDSFPLPEAEVPKQKEAASK